MGSHRQRTVLVRGTTDIGSAVAHRLFTAGHRVVLHDGPQPTVSRRTMAFTDAIFDGRCELAGVAAVRADSVEELLPAATSRAWIPVVVSLDLADLLRLLAPDVMVDARMRKREHPERQRGLAALTIGLGPNFTAADNAQATGEVVVLTTTTTQDSGILQHLVDEFGKSSGLRVKTIVASQSPAAAIGSASIAAGRCPVCIVGDPEKTASGRSTG